MGKFAQMKSHGFWEKDVVDSEMILRTLLMLSYFAHFIILCHTCWRLALCWTWWCSYIAMQGTLEDWFFYQILGTGNSEFIWRYICKNQKCHRIEKASVVGAPTPFKEVITFLNFHLNLSFCAEKRVFCFISC